MGFLHQFRKNHSNNHIDASIFSNRVSIFSLGSILSNFNVLALAHILKVPIIAKMCKIVLLLKKSLSKFARLGATSNQAQNSKLDHFCK